MEIRWVSLCLLCLLWISYTKGQDVDIRKLNYERLNKVLFALKDYGKRRRLPIPASDGSTPKPDTTRQYICTTVMSASEVNSFSTFSDSLTQNNRRVRAQYNEIDEDGNPIHGEKIMLTLYLDNLINEMEEDNGEDTHPIVILYSYNIPCSIPGHTCAEKLSADKARRDYSLIVGFTAFFGHTKEQTIRNKKASFNTLEQGGITTFYMRTVIPSPALYHKPSAMRNRKGSLALTRTSIDAVDGDSFQSLLYACLIKQPLAFCCTTDISAIDMDEVSRIVSFSINNMIYSCVDNLPIGGIIDDAFKTCLKQWIRDKIDNDCPSCLSGGVGIGVDRSKFFIGQCAEQAEKLSRRVGGSKGPGELSVDRPIWNHDRPIDRTGVLDKFNVAIRCTPRTLDPGSFCTKGSSTSRKRGPDILLNQNPSAKRPSGSFSSSGGALVRGL